VLNRNCKKQLASLSLRDADVKVLIGEEKLRELFEESGPDIPAEVRVKIKSSSERSIFIVDSSIVLIGNPTTGGATFIPLAEAASLIDSNLFQPLWNTSLELNRYLRISNSGLSEELSSLTGSNVNQTLLETILSRMKEDDINAISTEFYLRLASAVPSRIFTMKPEAGLQVWAELLDIFLADKGKVRYDNVTKLISIETKGKAERLPSNPWMLAFIGYLQYNGIPLRIINKVDSEEGTIFQGKISWNILA